MNTSERQSNSQSNYAGKELLIKTEQDLKHYNAWIVSTFIRNVHKLSAETPVLDFGSGIGTLSQIFLNQSGIRPEGVELDDSQRNIYAARGFKAYAQLSDTPNAYPLIFTSNVLEHIEDDVATLTSLKDKLTPGGLVLIYVPAFESIWTSMDNKVGHYRRYRQAELRAKLEQAGYVVKKSHYCDSLGFILAFFFKYLGNQNGEPSSWTLRVFDRVLLPLSKFMDLFFSPFFGKNVFVVAQKKD
jgi:SAM-dependent methyltransferase